MATTTKPSAKSTFTGRRHRRGRRLLVLLALVIALPLSALPGPVTGQQATGCGCATTGDYKSPKGLVSAKDVELLPPSATDGQSPKGTYLVSVSGEYPGLTLTIRRSADNATVLSLFTSAVDWGFSPDEDRFLIIRHDNGVTSWQLYDLTADDPDDPLLSPEPSSTASSGRLGFSPKGNYLAFVSLVNSTMANIQIWDIATGNRWESGNFSFIQGAPGEGKGGETYNGVTFGFSPDDRSFAYAYVSSASFAQLNVRNLTTGQYVVDTPYLAGFWQFSPCGDVFAMAQQMDQVSLDVRLVSTADGSLLNAGSTGFSFGAVAFKATETTHTMTLTTPSGPTTYDLAPNTAGEGCDEPNGDTTPPTWPGGTSITVSNVTATSVSISWSRAQDDTGVTRYRVSVYRAEDSGETSSGCRSCYSTGSGDSGGDSSEGFQGMIPAPPGTTHPTESSFELIGTLETTQTTVTVTGLVSGATHMFTVAALDAAANESNDEPSAKVTTSSIPVGEISGQVWFDSDGDGERGALESPFVFPQMIAWQLVESDVEGQFTIGGWPHSQSLSDGRYFFRDLEPDTYLIMKQGNWLQSAPAGFAPHIVTLDANQGVQGVDFFVTGESVSQTGTASISGTVWEDVNADAALGEGEPGIGNVTVCAYHSNAGWMNCEDSDDSGNYRFDNLPPGLYQVWADPSMVGNRFSTLPPDDLSHIFTLSTGGSETLNLGYAPGNATIAGTVWNDTKSNGEHDNDETGLADVEVCHWGPVTSGCTITDEDGAYEFNGLAPGEYEVWIDRPWDRVQTFPANEDDWEFELADGEFRSGIDFGLYSMPPGEIHGTVWIDIDNDEERDEGEPVAASVEVCHVQEWVVIEYAFPPGELVSCVLTDEAGRYAFEDVAADAYVVWPAETLWPRFGYVVNVQSGEVHTVDFGIEPPNMSAVIEPVADQDGREGDEISLEVVATDPEGGILLYGAIGLPAGLAIDEQTGVITGTLAPGSATGSPYMVTVFVEDDEWNEAQVTFTWIVESQANTPTGSDVTVSPLDEGGMTITFSSVTEAGETTVITGDTGPETPDGFLLGDPPVYYDISTTATFTGSATVCIAYDEAAYGSESALALFHYEDGAWENVTTSHDPESNTICGSVESFSPFVVLEQDTTMPEQFPPDCSSATPSIATLWPANHKLHEVTIEGVTDPDGDPITIVITAIHQDEPVLGPGSGSHGPDSYGVGTSVAEVRAERDAHGDGRVYHISFEASDGIDTCSGVVTVSVPKAVNAQAVDGGALYDSSEASPEEGEARHDGQRRR